MSTLYVNTINPKTGTAVNMAGNVSSSGDFYALGSVSASNNLTVGGNIHASGTITADALNVNEINSTSKTVNTLEIVDKVIMAASGTYPNNAGGSGLQIGGHSTGSAGTDIAATFFYNATDNSMDLSVTLSSSGDLYSLGSISSSNNLAVGGNLHITGTINQATVNSYLTANDEARLKAGATVSGSFHALGNSTLGNAATDVITVAGSLTASNGAYIQGQTVVLSGSNGYVNLGGGGSGGNVSLSGSMDIDGNVDINGTANLDDVDVDGSLVVDDITSLKAGATVSGSFHALGNSTLGNAATDTITVAGSLTASAGAYIQGQTIVLSGSNGYVNLGGGGSGGNVSLSGSMDIDGNVDINGTTNLDNTDIDGTFTVDGTAFDINATTTCAIDNTNTSNGVTINTVTSGGPISIGHSTSETTVNDNLTITGYLIADDEARLKAGATVSGSFNALANSNLGNASSDVVTVAGSLTASAGLDLSGQRVLISGSGGAIDLSDARGNAEFSGSVIAALFSSSGDVYALGSVSASNNLAVGGNIHASGSITADVLNINEINSTTKTVNTLEIVDKVILAASGTYPNNAGGAGLQIGGHSTGSAGTDVAATFFYNASNNSMDLSTTLSSSGDLYALGSISSSNNLAVGGNLHITGAISQATVNNYLTVTDEARLKAGATVSGSFHALGNSTLGNAATDVITVTGALTASNGAYIQGQTVILSGSNGYVNLGGGGSGGNVSLSGSMDIDGNVDINGTTNLDNTDIDGTFTVDGTAFDINATTTCAIDNTNTSNGVTINTVTSGGPISIGHSTSETTVNDNLTVTGDLAVNGDTTTLASANTTDPLLVIKNTTNDGYGSRLRFIKDKGAAGAANDEAGVIEFYADDANQDNICFASVTGSVAVHTNGQEGGKLTLKVASHDGEQQPGLVITDGSAEDEVDVTVGNGAASVTTVAGDLSVTTDVSVGGSTTLGNAAADDVHVTGSFMIKNTAYDYYPIHYGAAADTLKLNGVVYLNYQTSASMGIDVGGSNTLISGSGGFLDLRDAVGNLSLSGSLSMPGFSLSTNDAGTSNTVLGKLAGAALASGGNYNVLAGENSGNDLTTGDDNVIIGYNTAVVATTMSDTVVIGSGAGAALAASSTDADGTVLIGKDAGAALTSGQYNVAIGFGALDAEDVGNWNTAIGYNALTLCNSNQAAASVTGDADANANTAVGSSALSALTSGMHNVALGAWALDANQTGDSSVAIGTNALGAQTTGNSDDVGNTAVGTFCADAITTGFGNTAVGYVALSDAVDVDYAVAIGRAALKGNLTAAADGTVGIGFMALNACTTGAGNVAVGYQSLKTNIDGDFNTAVGYQALETFEADTDGHGSNTAVGYNAGQAVSTGTGNTIVGTAAGDALQGGDDNTLIGRDAGGATTAAGECVIIGAGAGAADLTSDADGSIFIGKTAGAAMTSGIGNTVVGYASLDAEDDGDQNTAIGYKTLAAQTGTSGEVGNTAVGYQAGQFITTATGTTFVGNQCGQGVGATKLTGNNNTGLGSDAGLLLRGAAHSNTFIGATAGDVTTTGVENTCLGFNADIQDATATNQVVIGNNITGTKDNAVFIGNDSSHIENDFNSDATWNHSSDVRQKTNIQDDTLGLDFISNLRTVTYSHKSPSEFPKEWTAYDPDDTAPMGGDKTIHGFIAQEVKEALDTAGCETFGGWSVDPDGRQRVSFEAFVMPLIKAVQEQQAQINELRAELDKKSDK